MKITPKQYAFSLIEALRGTSEGESRACLNNFFRIIEKNKNLKLIPGIIAEIEAINDRESGVTKAKVTTAVKISNETLKGVSKALEGLYKTKIKIEEKIDVDILGGVIVEVGNEILDASVRGRLSRFRHKLNT
jgi:F-type H+-transporting ATPase subunit delta